MILLNNLLKECPEIELIRSHIIGPEKSRRYYLSRGLWSLNIYDFSGVIVLNGEKHKIKRGYICLMPPRTAREFIFEERGLHRVVHFRFINDKDYSNSTPLLLDSGEKFEYLISKFDKAAKCHLINQERARAVLWELLWELTELPGIEHSVEQIPYHPALIKAITIIEMHFSEPLKVKEITAAVELSHNQLNRLFQKHCGCSIMTYIRRRRAEMAQHLLQNTNMRIKEIAGEIGMTNLQQFNKFIRVFFAKSPRALRGSSSALIF